MNVNLTSKLGEWSSSAHIPELHIVEKSFWTFHCKRYDCRVAHTTTWRICFSYRSATAPCGTIFSRTDECDARLDRDRSNSGAGRRNPRVDRQTHRWSWWQGRHNWGTMDAFLKAVVGIVAIRIKKWCTSPSDVTTSITSSQCLFDPWGSMCSGWQCR